MRWWLSGCVLLAAVRPGLADSDIRERDGQRFLRATAVAQQLNLKFDVVRPGRLATFCSQEPPATCVPLRLTDQNHLSVRGEVFIRQLELVQALSVSADVVDGRLRLQQAPEKAAASVKSTAYDVWGPGRGFEVGQTLPDIPLVDMNGREVRFSSYLGQRYILYCWASW